MTQHEQNTGLYHKLEGPMYQNGHWTVSIELRGLGPRTFYGETQKEVQAQMLEYLDEVVQELERAHASLHAILGNPPEQEKE